MVIALYEALREAGASEGKAQAAARAMADSNTRFDRLGDKVDTGFAEVRVQISARTWMNGVAREVRARQHSTG